MRSSRWRDPRRLPGCLRPVRRGARHMLGLPESASISVVIPIFDEERTLPELVHRLVEVLEAIGHPYELLFVNDGSRDRSLEQLRQLAREDPRIKVLSLSRNFGHQMAITAGLPHPHRAAPGVLQCGPP